MMLDSFLEGRGHPDDAGFFLARGPPPQMMLDSFLEGRGRPDDAGFDSWDLPPDPFFMFLDRFSC